MRAHLHTSANYMHNSNTGSVCKTAGATEHRSCRYSRNISRQVLVEDEQLQSPFILTLQYSVQDCEVWS